MKKTILFFGFVLSVTISAKAQFTRGFDSGNIDSFGWSVLNSGDANTWIADFPLFGTAQNGSKVARIAASTDALAHDDYLITPQMNVTAGLNDRLSFWVRSYNANFIGRMEVKVSTGTATSAADFSATILPSTQIPSTWTKINLNLSAYVGQSIYIGFHAMTNRYEFYIDAIINDAQPACNVPAPIISSASVNCTSGDSSVALSGLPAAGTWTLNRIGSSSSFTTGTGVSTTVSVPQNGDYYFYVVDANGCASGNSNLVHAPKAHDSPNNAPMIGTYTDTDNNGVVSVGDVITYEIQISNTGACPLYTTSVNSGDGSNPNLSFSGNPSYTIPELAGNSSVSVFATYQLTASDILNGSVTNSSLVNLHWSDNNGGVSLAYFPTCTTDLANLTTGSFVFQTLKYSPNPVKDCVWISNAITIDRIEIRSVLGQMAFSKKIEALQVKLDLSELNPGIYLATVFSGGNKKTVKILRE